MLVADESFRTLWGPDEYSFFEHAFSVKGEVFREIKNRKTLRFEFCGRHCFIKIHRGVGWREIFKNLFQLKKPVLGAENEFRAIRKLETLGIPTMKIRAFAMRGKNPAKRESFLVTDELQNKISLEDFCRDWKNNPPPESLKKRLTRALADTCAGMHFSGLNHRDCYICHFLLDKPLFEQGKIELTVLDLHRAEIRKKVPRRLWIKDVAGIFFSSMDLGLSKRDAFRFIAAYSRHGRVPDSRFWLDVLKTASALYRREWKHAPEIPER